jgi:hypothetical protein
MGLKSGSLKSSGRLLASFYGELAEKMTGTSSDAPVNLGAYFSSVDSSTV